MVPRVLVVQHEDDCPPALLGGWLEAAGVQLDVRRPYAGEALPDLTGHDGLLVLGGSMGARDDAEHPWLAPTRDLVREAAQDGVPTLGVCLGHQLAAVALGGAVGRHPGGQQLGLLDVGWTPEARDDVLLRAVARPGRGVHWNDDVVTVLPEGAAVLATTPDGAVQAARFAPTVWGVQLHPEVDAEVLRPWAASVAGSHEARGIDQAALLADVAAARDELETTWQPLAAELARLVRERSG